METICNFDHLVICACDIQQGVDWFAAHSGLQLPLGGAHPLMATHNHLSALSSSSFLEIIAADKQAGEPKRARWFNLDNEPFLKKLQSAPRLTTWVAGTSNLRASLKAAKQAGVDAGSPVQLTRGNLQWQIGLRDDGSLALDGAFPVLIQWPKEINPVNQMLDQGLRLNKLTIRHPDKQALSPFG